LAEGDNPGNALIAQVGRNVVVGDEADKAIPIRVDRGLEGQGDLLLGARLKRNFQSFPWKMEIFLFGPCPAMGALGFPLACSLAFLPSGFSLACVGKKKIFFSK
jgi:hypothetical protein